LSTVYTATSKSKYEDGEELVEGLGTIPSPQRVKKKKARPELFYPETWEGLSSEIYKFLATEEWAEMEWRPILFLIPSRIGIDKINTDYVPHIKKLLESKHSVGIVGGKPRASFYFIGYQDDEIIYLDPHLAQDSIPADVAVTPQLLQSYHCKAPQKMPFSQIDPSFTLGIFCKTLADFLEFTYDQLIYMNKEKSLSVFTISEFCPDYIDSCYHRKMRRRKIVEERREREEEEMEKEEEKRRKEEKKI